MNRCNLTFRAVLAAALLGAIVWLGLHREVLQTEALERELARFGACAPILFVVLYALATVLFVPGSVLTLAGGALFGPIWGTLWNLTGATLEPRTWPERRPCSHWPTSTKFADNCFQQRPSVRGEEPFGRSRLYRDHSRADPHAISVRQPDRHDYFS
jgi:hypothetical protein